MSIDTLKSSIPDYARDLRVNLGNVLAERGSPGLTPEQIAQVALSCALASGNQSVIETIKAHASNTLTDAQINAARSAAAIMAMNNVYYRFLHLVGNDEYQKMPAGLRMTVIGNPGVPKADFELMSLAVSAINGCGLCIESHEKVLRKEDVSPQAIQSSVRIAAVVKAVSSVLDSDKGELAAAA